MTGVFRQLYPDATVWLFDANTLFNRVLDNAASFLSPQLFSKRRDIVRPMLGKSLSSERRIRASPTLVDY